MVIICFKIPISVLEYFKDFGGYLLTGFSLTIEVDNWKAYEEIKSNFSDKLLVPSSAKIEDIGNKYVIKYGPFKIEAPKDKVVILDMDNFEVDKFAEYLSNRYNLKYCSIKKEIDLLEIKSIKL